jgi:hypothetical protein
MPCQTDRAGSQNGFQGNRGPNARQRGRAGGVTIRITDAAGTLVRELQDRNAGPGLNRAVWDFSWTGADPIPGQPQGGGGGFFGRFGGGQGPPAVPGMYMATIEGISIGPAKIELGEWTVQGA